MKQKGLLKKCANTKMEYDTRKLYKYPVESML